MEEVKYYLDYGGLTHLINKYITGKGDDVNKTADNVLSSRIDYIDFADKVDTNGDDSRDLKITYGYKNYSGNEVPLGTTINISNIITDNYLDSDNCNISDAGILTLKRKNSETGKIELVCSIDLTKWVDPDDYITKVDMSTTYITKNNMLKTYVHLTSNIKEDDIMSLFS